MRTGRNPEQIAEVQQYVNGAYQTPHGVSETGEETSLVTRRGNASQEERTDGSTLKKMEKNSYHLPPVRLAAPCLWLAERANT